MDTFGRKVIYTPCKEITADNVIKVLANALSIHRDNQSEIEYLYDYLKGNQDIKKRTKAVRPEICNKIVENIASEIVTFKSGYLLGEPIQYSSRGKNYDAVKQLNDFMFAEEKASKDKELCEWMHICGTGYRMAFPDTDDKDECPYEIYTLDPRNTFVVYSSGLGHKPMMGVVFSKDEAGDIIYSCYAEGNFFEVSNKDGELTVVSERPLAFKKIPIVEYPLNIHRIGAFENVIDILNAINTIDSNRVDGVEQFIQALMVFKNVNIDKDKFNDLRELGAIRIADIDQDKKADIQYLVQELDQSSTQTLIDYMYQLVLEICCMPNRNGGSSTSDTGSAVIMRDGWSSAEASAKDTELMFKKSEREFLKVILDVCRNKLSFSMTDVDIKFTRRNYENLSQKVTVLTQLLGSGKVHPQLAFEWCNITSDPYTAYELSQEYLKEQEKKQREMFHEKLNSEDDGSEDSEDE